MQFINTGTPTIGRRLLGGQLNGTSDGTRLRPSPVDFSSRPASSLLSGFEVIPTNEFLNRTESRVSLVSEDEGLELSSGDGSSHPVVADHDCVHECCKRVTINVSGLRFETQLKTLNRLPHTLLGNPSIRKQFWDSKHNEYFFDRHRPSFQAILYYYQSGGRLKCPFEVPIDIFINELEFFGFDSDLIDEYKGSEGFILEKEFLLPENKTLKAIWQLLEQPNSSLGARLMAIVSVAFICLSIAIFCFETVPEYRVDSCVYTYRNVTENNSTKLKLSAVTINFGSHFFILESICVAWFVFELVIRFISCPSRLVFLKSVQNWVDVMSVTPHIVFVVTYCVSGVCMDSSASNALVVLRISRVTRVLKLGKHSRGLQVLAMTLRNSIKELGMFVMFLFLGVIIFSTAMYFSEAHVNYSHFHSIPDTFWWSIVSMTTVGYGDMFPQGVAGKIVGTFTVLGGILTIALPVPIIVTNFNSLYNAHNGRTSVY
ncbi:potassium voltage-gated channel subfamily A member 1-like [Argopecten irradians]|uniref:potassium voltage-gated channel subfamily A member 1-like n=1 Tax=Argopecten irradians TaxID=31199 RepID=UPI0037142DC1